jgi:hypothetical protein
MEDTEFIVPLLAVPTEAVSRDGGRSGEKDVIISTDVEALISPTGVSADGKLSDALDSNIYWFLLICGMIYHDKSPFIRWILLSWNGAVLLILLASVGFNIYLLAFDRRGTADVLADLTGVAQLLGLLWGIYFNCNRLHACYPKNYVVCLRRSWGITVASVVAMLAMNLSCYFILLGSSSASYRHYMAHIGEMLMVIAMCLLLGANFLFLTADTLAAAAQLHMLLTDLESGNAPLKSQVNSARREFELILGAGWKGNSVIMLAAIFNIFMVFAIVVVPGKSIGHIFLLIGSVFFREVLLAGIGLYYIAVVNEKYDLLIELLALHVDRKLDDTSSFDDSLGRANATLNCLYVRPITFPIVGMTLKRKDVLLRFCLWLFSIVLGIVAKKI